MIRSLRNLGLPLRSALSATHRKRRLCRLAEAGRAPLNVIFYHRVADRIPGEWTISRDDFRRHVEHCLLGDNACGGLEGVTLDEVQARIDARENPRPTVTFTFDDGYAENMDFALPLLIEKKMPTVYFVATEHVRHQRPFEHDVKAGRPLPVNTKADIRELADAGIEIGLHTKNHVDFSVVTDSAVIRDEIIGGKNDLEDMIGRPVKYFAVPYGLPGQLTREVIETTQIAGLKGFCSAFGGYNVPGRDSFHIRRFHGDPEFARMVNWLSFDPHKLLSEPQIHPQYFVTDPASDL